MKSDSKFQPDIHYAIELLLIPVKKKRVLLKENMAQFEVAQIANLCCEDAEEAKALIPRYLLYYFS